MANLNLSQADKESIINSAESLIKLADSSGYTPTSGPNKTDIKQAAKQIIAMFSKPTAGLFSQEEINTILDFCRVIKGRVYGAEVYKRNHPDIMSTTAAMFQDVKKIEDAISFSLEHAKKIAIEAKRQAEIAELEAIRAEQQRKAEEAAKEVVVSKFIGGIGEQIRQLQKALTLEQISKIEQAKKSSQQEFLKQYPDALSDKRVHKALENFDKNLIIANDRVQAVIDREKKAAEALLLAKLKEEEITAAIKKFEQQVKEGIGKLGNPNIDIDAKDKEIKDFHTKLPDILSAAQKREADKILGRWDSATVEARERVGIADGAIAEFEQHSKEVIKKLINPQETFDAATIKAREDELEILKATLPKLSNGQQQRVDRVLGNFTAEKIATEGRVKVANDLFEQIKSEVPTSTRIVGETNTTLSVIEYQQYKTTQLKEKVKLLNPDQQKAVVQIFKEFDVAVAVKASAAKDLLSKISDGVQAGTAKVNDEEATHTDIEAQKAAINLLRTEAAAFKAFSPEQQEIVDNSFKAFNKAVKDKNKAAAVFLSYIRGKIDGLTADIGKTNIKFEDIKPIKEQIEKLKEEEVAFKSLNSDQKAAIKELFTTLDEKVKGIELKIAYAEEAANKAVIEFKQNVRNGVDNKFIDPNVAWDSKEIDKLDAGIKDLYDKFKTLSLSEPQLDEVNDLLQEWNAAVVDVKKTAQAAEDGVAAYKASVESKITFLEDPNTPCDTATIKQFVQEINSLSLPEKLSDTQIATVRGISSQWDAAIQAANDRVRAGDDAKEALLNKANRDFKAFEGKVAANTRALKQDINYDDIELLRLGITNFEPWLSKDLLTKEQQQEVTDLVKQFNTDIKIAKFKADVNNVLESLGKQMEARTLTVEEINKINEQIVESKSNLLFKETLNSEQKEEIDEHWKRFDKELEIAKKKVAKDKAALETAATIELGGVDKAPLPPPPPPAKLSVLSSLSNALSEVDSAKSIVKYDTENQDWNAATFNKENVVALFNETALKLTVADLAFSSPKKMQFLADDKGDLNPNHILATVLVLQEVSKSNQLQAEGSKNRDLPITLRNFEDKALLEVLTNFNAQLFSNNDSATKDLRSIRINYVGENEDLQKLVDAHNAIHDHLLKGNETIDSDLKHKFEQQKNKISQSITTPSKDGVPASDMPKVVAMPKV
ncbi:MAG: hypothetical protein ABSA84_02040 [Gammaproteobacteria bacterium]